MTKKKKKMGGVREGAGRPATLVGAVRKQVMLDAATIKAIALRARIDRISFSEALRQLVQR